MFKLLKNLFGGNKPELGMADEDFERLSAEAKGYEYDINKTCLTYKDDTSDKFWCINWIDDTVFVFYGKNGTLGRIEFMKGGKEFAEKQIKEKLGKGYKQKPDSPQDKFTQHKSNIRPTLDSMYVMFAEENVHIQIAAVKSLCERFCDLLREYNGNEEKIKTVVKPLVIALNNISNEHYIIETEERELLCEFILDGMGLANVPNEEDITEEWREW